MALTITGDPFPPAWALALGLWVLRSRGGELEAKCQGDLCLLVTFPKMWHSIILVGLSRSSAKVKRYVASSSTRPCTDKGRALPDFVRDKCKLRGAAGTQGCAHLLQPDMPPGEGSKDGANHLYFTLAGSQAMHSESLLSIPADGGRNELAARSRKECDLHFSPSLQRQGGYVA